MAISPQSKNSNPIDPGQSGAVLPGATNPNTLDPTRAGPVRRDVLAPPASADVDFITERIAELKASAAQAGSLGGLVGAAADALKRAHDLTLSTAYRYISRWNAARDERQDTFRSAGLTQNSIAYLSAEEKTSRALRAMVAKESEERATTIATSVTESLQRLQDGVEKSEYKAALPPSFGNVEMDLPNLLVYERRRSEIQLVPLPKLLTLYAGAIEHDDTEVAQLIEGASVERLQKILSEGQKTARKPGYQSGTVERDQTLAVQLLREFQMQAAARIPPEIKAAKGLFDALLGIHQRVIGFDPRPGGPMTPAEFSKRWMNSGDTGGFNEQARLDVDPAWLHRNLGRPTPAQVDIPGAMTPQIRLRGAPRG